MEALQLLGNHLRKQGIFLGPAALQKIVNICAEIIVIQDQQEFEDKTRAAIDIAGGCSVCGDLDGYSCICEDEDEI